jgi:hypothetical protein
MSSTSTSMRGSSSSSSSSSRMRAPSTSGPSTSGSSGPSMRAPSVRSLAALAGQRRGAAGLRPALPKQLHPVVTTHAQRLYANTVSKQLADQVRRRTSDYLGQARAASLAPAHP